MKIYYKEGQQVQRPKTIFYKGFSYTNPTDEILTKAGYEIAYPETPVVTITNEDIKQQREMAYRHKADSYFIAYQAYLDLDELEKAKEMKELWLAERQKINEQYPYITE